MQRIFEKARPEKYTVKYQCKTGIIWQISIILGTYKMCFKSRSEMLTDLATNAAKKVFILCSCIVRISHKLGLINSCSNSYQTGTNRKAGPKDPALRI
jgi:hypothetical protein